MIGGNELVRAERRVDVGDGLAIATTVVLPFVRPRALVQCLPGGGCSRSYWSLQVEGFEPGAYDFAAYAAERGFAVVTADHLGTGDSDDPTSLEDLDAEPMAAAMSACFARVRHDLGLDGVPGVGVGHSFGAGMTIVQQDRHADFDALGIFGWSSIRLAVVDEQGVRWPVDARDGMAGAGGPRSLRFFNIGPDPDPAIHTAARAARTRRTHRSGERDGQNRAGRNGIIGPGVITPAAGRVTVPVFLGWAEFDATLEPDAEPALYASAPSVTSHLIPGAYHWQNVAPNRHELWDAFLNWLDATVSHNHATGGSAWLDC
jgi:pimeloyl-ACP methyl ester carboxylesterase